METLKYILTSPNINTIVLFICYWALLIIFLISTYKSYKHFKFLLGDSRRYFDNYIGCEVEKGYYLEALRKSNMRECQFCRKWFLPPDEITVQKYPHELEVLIPWDNLKYCTGIDCIKKANTLKLIYDDVYKPMVEKAKNDKNN